VTNKLKGLMTSGQLQELQHQQEAPQYTAAQLEQVE